MFLKTVGHVLRLSTFHTSLATPNDPHLLQVSVSGTFFPLRGKTGRNPKLFLRKTSRKHSMCSKVKMLNTRSVSPLTLRLKLEYCLTKKNEEIVETWSVLKILQIKIETTNTQLAMTFHLRSTITQFLLDQNI